MSDRPKKEEMPLEDAESVSADDIADMVCAAQGIERPVRKVPETEKPAPAMLSFRATKNDSKQRGIGKR